MLFLCFRSIKYILYLIRAWYLWLKEDSGIQYKEKYQTHHQCRSKRCQKHQYNNVCLIKMHSRLQLSKQNDLYDYINHHLLHMLFTTNGFHIGFTEKCSKNTYFTCFFCKGNVNTWWTALLPYISLQCLQVFHCTTLWHWLCYTCIMEFENLVEKKDIFRHIHYKFYIYHVILSVIY